MILLTSISLPVRTTYKSKLSESDENKMRSQRVSPSEVRQQGQTTESSSSASPISLRRRLLISLQHSAHCCRTWGKKVLPHVEKIIGPVSRPTDYLHMYLLVDLLVGGAGDVTAKYSYAVILYVRSTCMQLQTAVRRSIVWPVVAHRRSGTDSECGVPTC